MPRALGVGYDAIDDVLGGHLAVGVLAALAVGKLLAWWVALGSGTSGGTLGAHPAHQRHRSARSSARASTTATRAASPLGAFAVVAMAATFGSATQAPFTAIVFVFELTRDYDVILPLMLASVIAGPRGCRVPGGQPDDREASSVADCA